MMKNSITGHMLVKNEDRFIWYSITSILPFVDKLIIFDTGSTDKSVAIIKSFKSSKIFFRERKITSIDDIGKLREDQLKMTKTDWIWIIDGDEVYPFSLGKEIVQIVKEKRASLEGIVVGRIDLLGDIYHYQSESVGTYNLFGKRGHIVIRLINKAKIAGLHVKGRYPYEGYYDKNGVEIIHHDPKYFRFTSGKLFHAMYLSRSTKGANLVDVFNRKKWKMELGRKINNSVVLPEVFGLPRPSFIPDVTGKRSPIYFLAATLITPAKILKRKIFTLK